VRFVWRVGRYLVLGAFLVVAAYPVLWMVMTGLKSRSDAMANTWGPPASLRFENFAEVWSIADFPRLFANSALVSGAAVLLTLCLAAPAGYAIARLRFRGRGAVFLLFLGGMMVPVHVTLIPLLKLYHLTGLYDTRVGLIAVYVAFSLPISIVLFQAFFREIPEELEEAAALDGCGYWGTFLRVSLPLAKPAVVGVAMLTLVNVWNEFVFALVLLSSKAVLTIPLGVSGLQGQYGGEFHLIAAALAIAVLPPLLVYALAQRQLIRGITAGAVKG
jgi:raffinose/stachyose/melibiose transport system permease protein